MLTMEDYLSMCRLTNAGVPVTLDVDINTAFNTKDTKGYNVIAEIKGTDPALKDEIVMVKLKRLLCGAKRGIYWYVLRYHCTMATSHKIWVRWNLSKLG